MEFSASGFRITAETLVTMDYSLFRELVQMAVDEIVEPDIYLTEDMIVASGSDVG